MGDQVITKITNEDEYDKALEKLHELMNAEPFSDDEKELLRLAEIIEKYEDEHYPIWKSYILLTPLTYPKAW